MAPNGLVPRQTMAAVLVPMLASPPTRDDEFRSRCIWPCFDGTSPAHNDGETASKPAAAQLAPALGHVSSRRSFDEAELRELIPEVRE